ncbi:hypothetical protein GCM10017744_036400 [Streptomyces antimycoticus]
MARALLMADEHMPDLRGVHHRVVGGEDRATGNAEDGVRTHFLEGTDEGLRARDVLDGGGLRSAATGPRLGVMGPGACSVIGILFSKMRFGAGG